MYGVCAQVNDVGVVKVSLELAAEGGDGGERGRFRPHVDEVCRILIPLFLPRFHAFAASYAGRDRPINQWLKDNRTYRSTARASYCTKKVVA